MKIINKACTIWFTGLPSSGKTTLSEMLYKYLKEKNYPVEIFDGDIVRENLSKGLGFSKEDRDTNIKRIGFVCKLLTRNNVFAIAAAISPYKEIRNYNRKEIKNYVEVFIKCPLEVCIKRDVKGLYKKAISGEIKNFTGISDPYEEPDNPEVIIETDRLTPEESLQIILNKLKSLSYVE